MLCPSYPILWRCEPGRHYCQLFPYKISVHQILAEADQRERKLYSGWLPSSCDDNVDTRSDSRRTFTSTRAWTLQKRSLLVDKATRLRHRSSRTQREEHGSVSMRSRDAIGPDWSNDHALERLRPSTPDSTGWSWKFLERALVEAGLRHAATGSALDSLRTEQQRTRSARRWSGRATALTRS